MISYCGVKLTRKTWDEMQRDAYDPKNEPKTYFCEVCNHRHRYQSEIGFLHNEKIPIEIRFPIDSSSSKVKEAE